MFTEKFKEVWLWNEWPDRQHLGFGQDSGIDLVAETDSGSLWAIQSKCYLGTTVPREEITSFMFQKMQILKLLKK